MSGPVESDGNAWWQAIGAVAVVLGLVTGVIKWLLGKIEAVRIGNDQAIERVRTEVIGKFDAHIREYREDRNKAQEWREDAKATMASMVTRVELERQLDRQSENLLERLDVRIVPLIERRRARGAGED